MKGSTFSPSVRPKRFNLARILFGIVVLAAFGPVSARAQDIQIRAFHQLAPSQGWALINHQLLFTDSDGARWTEITPKGADSIGGVFFLDRARGWSVISTGPSGAQIARTIDGGAHWSVTGFAGLNIEDSSPWSGEASVSFVDSTHGWILLRSASSPNFSRGVLLATADGGVTWTRLPEPPIADGLTFITRRNGFLAGGPDGSRFFLTRDGGNTWQAAHLPKPSEGELTFNPPVFISALHGSVSARLTTGNVSTTAIYRTRDGGMTWTPGPFAPITETASGEQSLLTQAIAPGASILRAEVSAGGDGWMHAVAGSCAGFKTSCAQSAHMLAIHAGIVTEITPQSALKSGPSPFASTTTSTHSGFDKCSAATVSQMSTWWTSSPYFDANIYIGGVARGCSQPNLTASWVTSTFGQGWRLIPTWVGPQAPCNTFTSKISTNTTTAFNQGVSEATSAISAANALGLSTSVVYYDMESYNSGDATCKAAVNSFISGWVQKLRGAGFIAGVYGSPSDANSGWATIANVPDDVWIAVWNGVASTTGLSPLPDSLWSNSQRIHQYQGGHNETYGGVTFNIDNDIENGRVAAP